MAHSNVPGHSGPVSLRDYPQLDDAWCRGLFDDSGHLVNSRCDELEHEPSYPHPLLDFYRDYSQRFLEHRSVFTPYEAAVAVSTISGVFGAFRSSGIEDRLPHFRLAGARERYRLDPANVTVGILTAGGNAPGLNTVIDSIVKRHLLLATARSLDPASRAVQPGVTIKGYLRGYNGLLTGERMALDHHITDPISLAAGSILKCRRGEKPADQDASRVLFQRMVDTVQRDRLDVLYVVGGNGTIRAAIGLCEVLAARGTTGEQGRPVRVVAAPKTMDNDINFTDVTFGFRTTVENAVEAIRRIHVEAETAERIGVVELFGAKSGFVAVHAAYASGEADYVLIPELVPDPLNAASAIERAALRLAERYKKHGHALLVVAEGASAAFKPPDTASHKEPGFEVLLRELDAALRKALGAPAPAGPPELLVSRPLHLVRSTGPNAFDVDLCKQTGKLMVDAALGGFSRCVLSLWHGDYVLVPLETAVARLKQVDVGAYYFLSMMEKYLLRSGPQARREGPLADIPEEYFG